MDVQLMTEEILRVANPVIGESLLPDSSATDLLTDRIRISALDQLDGAFQREGFGRREEQVNVVRHEHECMQLEFSLSAVAVKSLQEKPDIGFDDEEPCSLKSRKRHEIGPGRRHQSSRFHLAVGLSG